MSSLHAHAKQSPSSKQYDVLQCMLKETYHVSEICLLVYRAHVYRIGHGVT